MFERMKEVVIMPQKEQKSLSEKFFEIMELKSAKAMVIILSVAVIVMVIALASSASRKRNLEVITESVSAFTDENIPPPPTPKPVMVHIKGEVNNPGLYELEKDMRVADALEIADGVTENADVDRINLAEKLQDEQEVYVPAKGEADIKISVEGKSSTGGKSSAKTPAPQIKPVNINTAGLEQLTTLPGIGPSYAQSIIGFRQETGGFKRPDEIMRVKGISRATYDRIKDYIYTD